MEKVKGLRVWEGRGVYKLESGDREEGVVTWVGRGLPYNPLVRGVAFRVM
jgi:hypothetical protein